MIKIINYGLGNINAFFNIFRKLNIEAEVINNKEQLLDFADKDTKLILPGVGSFDYALELLEKSGMKETLNFMVLEKKDKNSWSLYRYANYG